MVFLLSYVDVEISAPLAVYKILITNDQWKPKYEGHTAAAKRHLIIIIYFLLWG